MPMWLVMATLLLLLATGYIQAWDDKRNIKCGYG